MFYQNDRDFCVGEGLLLVCRVDQDLVVEEGQRAAEIENMFLYFYYFIEIHHCLQLTQFLNDVSNKF